MRRFLPSRELVALALSSSFFATAGAYAVHASMPHNAIELPGEKRFNAQIVLPEGWKFFTKDAREPRVLAFTREGGAWRSSDFGPNADARFFGLDRVGRTQGVEIGLLLEAAKGEPWSPCSGSPVECLDAATPVAEPIVNLAGAQTLCGDVALVRQAPVPWAWAHAAAETRMPSTVLRMTVQC
jgi:antimicrobial peptide system SdpA family protein